MKQPTARRRPASSYSARARVTWTGACVPETLLVLSSSGPLAGAQRTLHAAAAKALGLASPTTSAAMSWFLLAGGAMRPGAPVSGAHRSRGEKCATSRSVAPALGVGLPLRPPDQQMQAGPQAAAAASASAGSGAAVAPLQGRNEPTRSAIGAAGVVDAQASVQPQFGLVWRASAMA